MPETVLLLSDSDDDGNNDDDNDNNNNNNNNNDLTASVANNRKRPRYLTRQPIPSDAVIDLVDDPTPPKLHKFASSTKSFIPETRFSDFPKLSDPTVVARCTSNLSNSCSRSTHILSGDAGFVGVVSDDEAEGLGRTCLENAGACAGFDIGFESERSPKCTVKEKQSENKKLVPDIDLESWLDIDSTFCLYKGVESIVPVEHVDLRKKSWMKDGKVLADHHVEQDLEKRLKSVAKENCQENEKNTAGVSLESLEKHPILQSTCHLGNLRSTKTYSHMHEEDDTNPVQHIVVHDCEKENVRLDNGGAIHKPSIGDNSNTEKKQNRAKQAADRKKLMEEKKLKKEQEKQRKADLKAEAARSKQLDKEMKKLERYKFSEKDIEANIDPKVLSSSLGGSLLTMLNQKSLRYVISPNVFEKSIVWRMILPEGISQNSTVQTDIQYILLIYDDPEEFCNHANDGSLMDHISSVRKEYPYYTICCLTNRLMSFINKREQQKYKNLKGAYDWKRPPVEELFAKLTTQFANVHSRQCADEAEVAEHVVGLTINLAKCHSRKKLTHLAVNANGCNVPKDCVERGLIMKHPWLKALVSIPKVQPRFAVAIWKKYPTMKSLLCVYMDPTMTVHEKELLLEDLPLEGLLGSQTRLGEKCSKRVFRVLMAQNGSIKTDDVEDGADYFSSR